MTTQRTRKSRIRNPKTGSDLKEFYPRARVNILSIGNNGIGSEVEARDLTVDEARKEYDRLIWVIPENRTLLVRCKVAYGDVDIMS